MSAQSPKTAHTPGPYSTGCDNYITAQKDGKTVAIAVMELDESGAISMDEMDANERLLKAAPEMLAALEAVTDYAMRLDRERNGEQVNEPDCVQEARAAIARAKGVQS